MSAYLKKGIAVWMLAFLTFVAFLNAFNAVLSWTFYGNQFEFEPYVVDQFIGRIKVIQYFWISTAITFVLLGCTAVMVFRKPPLDPDLVDMFAQMNEHFTTYKTALEEGLEANMKSMENLRTDLLERMEAQERVTQEFFNTHRTSLESTRKETLDALQKQDKSIQKVSRQLSSAVEISVNNVREEVLRAAAKQEEAIMRLRRSSRKSMRTIYKVTADLDEMKARLETLENALAPPQPKLTSQSSSREIKGIGPRLAEELKTIGITDVGQFLTADPAIIDEKTRLTRETAEHLQRMIQLLMIPGIDKIDVELLEKVGITNRKELAEEDPFELHRKLSKVAETYVEQGKISKAEKPTVEDVLSWVKLAKM